jgi:hypothetical protein
MGGDAFAAGIVMNDINANAAMQTVKDFVIIDIELGFGVSEGAWYYARRCAAASTTECNQRKTECAQSEVQTRH